MVLNICLASMILHSWHSSWFVFMALHSWWTLLLLGKRHNSRNEKIEEGGTISRSCWRFIVGTRPSSRRVEAWLVGLPQENKFKGEQGLGWMPGHNHKTFSTILRTGVDTTKENESWRTQQRRTIIQQETMPAPDRPYRSRVGGVPHRGARHHRARVCERNQSMFRYVQRNTNR